MIRASDPASIAMRDAVIIATLGEHPWATAGMLARTILDETGGPPALITGALYLPGHYVYSRLRKLERDAVVVRAQITSRIVLWYLNR